MPRKFSSRNTKRKRRKETKNERKKEGRGEQERKEGRREKNMAVNFHLTVGIN